MFSFFKRKSITSKSIITPQQSSDSDSFNKTLSNSLFMTEEEIINSKSERILLQHAKISLNFIPSIQHVVTNLTLLNVDLSSFHTTQLMPLLSNLISLTLSQNTLTQESSSCLLRSLFSSKIEYLNLASTGLEDGCMVLLVLMVVSNPQLKALWIGFNKLTDFTLLAKEFRHCSLNVLSIVGNSGSKGVKLLKKAMVGKHLFH